MVQVSRTFECDDVISSKAHVSRKQKAADYRAERSLMGCCFVPLE